MGLELSSRAAPGPSSLHVAGRVGSVNLTPPPTLRDTAALI